MTFAKQVIDFYNNIKPPTHLPAGVEVLEPFKEPAVKQTVDAFYTKFFQDNNPRTYLIGINPGRFGGGTTGIPFTDPIRLQEVIGIDNAFDPKPELSSRFIYQMIEAMGGVDIFYRSFYFTSVSPLGFVKEGRNLNYYDIKELQNGLENYIVDHFRKQLNFGAKPVAYSLGKGQNIKYLKWLNKKYRLFETIEPLPHPRWVMQYRLKRLDEFISLYKERLSPHLYNS